MSDLIDEVEEAAEEPAPKKEKKKKEKAPKQSASPLDQRAVASIRRAKGYGGLGGFVVAALGAYMHGELITQILTRALIGGIAGYMIAWLAAVVVWRRIVRAEVIDRMEQYRRARATAIPDGEAQ